ncbi:MAG: hypothetical protein Q8L60_17530 [Gammaproteobacteria bacterium]|nr:hypothetical protein [Gammaproteobacteria bacterium]
MPHDHYDRRPRGWKLIAILVGATLAFAASMFSIAMMVISSF